MKTTKRVEIEPIYTETLPDVSEMEENKIYISKKYNCTGHRCFCGCGLLTILPIGKKHGWTLTEQDNGQVSFHPSVGNYQYPCKSHYIIYKNGANFV